VAARADVEAAIEASQGGVMVLDRYCPWENHLFKSENAKAAQVLYVVFPSNRGGWNWQAVPDAPGSFGMRNECPQSWRGLRDKDLARKTGAADAVFCHPAGFIGSCLSKGNAVATARLAILNGKRNG